MHYIITKGSLISPIREDREQDFLSALKKELRANIKQNDSQEDKEIKFINTTYNIFKDHGLKLKYCGFYEPDPLDPERTNPRPHNIGIGCSGIPIYQGVIGTTIRLYGKSLYVPDVGALEREDPEAHFSCDPEMRGAEIVIAATSKFKEGNFKGKSAVRMTLDLDIKRRNPFSLKGALHLEETCISYINTIFPESPNYNPIEGTHTRKELELSRH